MGSFSICTQNFQFYLKLKCWIFILELKCPRKDFIIPTKFFVAVFRTKPINQISKLNQ